MHRAFIVRSSLFFLFLSFELVKRLYACACSGCCQTDCDSSKVNTQKWQRTWPSLDVRAEIILHHFLDNSEYIVISVIMLPLRNLHKTCML